MQSNFVTIVGKRGGGGGGGRLEPVLFDNSVVMVLLIAPAVWRIRGQARGGTCTAIPNYLGANGERKIAFLSLADLKL